MSGSLSVPLLSLTPTTTHKPKDFQPAPEHSTMQDVQENMNIDLEDGSSQPVRRARKRRLGGEGEDEGQERTLVLLYLSHCLPADLFPVPPQRQ